MRKKPRPNDHTGNRWRGSRRFAIEAPTGLTAGLPERTAWGCISRGISNSYS
jgi:hypothetical protein